MESKNPYPLKLYGSPSRHIQTLAENVATELETQLGLTTYKEFSNGEFLAHHNESIRDCDVYLIIQPRFGNKATLSYDLDECETMVYALKQGEPNRITVVLPHLPYSRQDRPSNYREPILVQKIPMRLQMAGADKIVVLRLHNPSSYNAHPLAIPIINIDTNNIMIEHIKSQDFDLQKLKIVSPDLGTAPSCRKLAQELGIPGSIVIMNKFHDPKAVNQTEVMEVIGNPSGFNCLIPDDIADTCGTAKKSFLALKDRGALDIYFMSVHGILSGNAITNLNSVDFSGIWLSDTCDDFNQIMNYIKNNRFGVIPTAKLIAKVIRNLNNGESVTDLQKNGDK